MIMSGSLTPNVVSMILMGSSNTPTEFVVQVVDLKLIRQWGSRYGFMANDGNSKIQARLPPHFAAEVLCGDLQNFGLIRVTECTCNEAPNQQNRKILIVKKCDVVSPSLGIEIVKEEPEVVLTQVKKSVLNRKPKGELFVKSDANVVPQRRENSPPSIIKTKSAAQIAHEKRANAAPAVRTSMSTRVLPLGSLSPSEESWTIKVQVTKKGVLRNYNNERGGGWIFDVELIDEDGTQIRAIMFNEAAKKFYTRFEMGKIYFISRGILILAKENYKIVPNDYELSLNENALVEEVTGEGVSFAETKYKFVKIDCLGTFVNGQKLVDVVGVVRSVSSTLSVRRKCDNETIPKREILVADDSGKTVSVSLWNDLGTNTGRELLDMVKSAPVVAISCLKVGDFQGVSLSTVGRSTVRIDPDIPEAKKLRTWYDSVGKRALFVSAGSCLTCTSKDGSRTLESNVVPVSHITSDRNLGKEPALFSIKAVVSNIESDQTMWFRACKVCNRKVTRVVGYGGYWCESCQKNDDDYSLRYIIVMHVLDSSGETCVSVFNEEAEKIIGCSAYELRRIKKKSVQKYVVKLKQAIGITRVFRVIVAWTDDTGEMKRRITVKNMSSPVDSPSESSYSADETSDI